MSLLDVILNLIVVITVFQILRSFVVRLVASGRLTGNRYEKRDDGKLWVKHPNGEWMLLEDHERDQKKLRENK